MPEESITETTTTALVRSTALITAVQQVNTELTGKLRSTEIDRLEVAIQQLTSSGVTSDRDYKLAGGLLRAQRKWRDLWGADWKPITEFFYRPYSMARDFFNPMDKRLEKMGRSLEEAMRRYLDHQRQVKEEQERKLREEADRLRQEAETQAVSEMERGNVAAAKLLKAQATAVPTAVVLPDPTPHVEGLKTKGTWKIKVTDKMALVKAVADGKAPLTALDANESVLRKMAIAQDGLNIPGVEAKKETGFGVIRK